MYLCRYTLNIYIYIYLIIISPFFIAIYIAIYAIYAAAHTTLVEYDVLVNFTGIDNIADSNDVAGTVGADGTFVNVVEPFSGHLSHIYLTLLRAKSYSKYF